MFGYRTLVGAAIIGGAIAAFLFLSSSARVVVFKEPASNVQTVTSASSTITINNPRVVPGPASSSNPGPSPVPPQPATPVGAGDLPNQEPLPNPPEIVKGIYLTNWTAGSSKRLAELEKLVDRTDLNAMVIDVKDYSGYVAYRTGIPEVVASGAEKDIRILRPNAMIKELHDKGIYLIARVTVFQDPILAKAHPEWAVQDNVTGGVWKDRKGISWMNTASKEVWNYVVVLARDAFARGFDEVNFDYIRFPSDGDLSRAEYPGVAPGTLHATVVKNFFAYLRKELPGKKISADLFGLTTSSADDLGIGQKILDAYPNFDFVSPMVYPSHFATGYIGLKNPAEHPYEVISYSMTKALDRFKALVSPKSSNASSTATSSEPVTEQPSAPLAKLRPWLQAFNLGATYTPAMVQAQIKAADEVLGGTPHYAGWLLWDPGNHYYSYQ